MLLVADDITIIGILDDLAIPFVVIAFLPDYIQ